MEHLRSGHTVLMLYTYKNVKYAASIASDDNILNSVRLYTTGATGGFQIDR